MKRLFGANALVRRDAWMHCMAALLAISLGSRPTLGQTPADKAAAQVLFDEGKRFMEQGNFEQACARFEESQRLDAGIGTLYQLAACLEKLGRTASAWALYMEVATLTKLAGQVQREEMARAQAARLEPTLPRLLVKIEGPAGEDFVVERDGTAIGKGQWGTAVPVDPGTHIIKMNAEGYRPFEQAVQVRPGETKTIVVTAEPRPKSSASGAAVPPVAGSAKPPASRNPWRIAAYATGGTGLALLAGSVGFGLVARSKNEASVPRCPDNRCYPDGAELRNEAIMYGNVATGFFAVGVGLLGAGVGFMFVKPKAADTAPKKAVAVVPWVGSTGMGILFEGKLQ